MSVPFHAEISIITVKDALDQCDEVIQVYTEASSMLNAERLVNLLHEAIKEQQFTNTNIATSMLNLLTVNDTSIDLLPLFEKLAKTNPTAVWNTAIELNLMCEHYLECDD